MTYGVSSLNSGAAPGSLPPDDLPLQRDIPHADHGTEGLPLISGAEILREESRLPLTERVLAGVIGGEPMAYPFSVLWRVFVVNDMVGGMPVVAFWQPGVASALDTPRIDQGREVGTAALFRREVNGQVLTFAASSAGTIRDEQTGSTWNAFGVATDGLLAGTQLQQLPATGHFWFAWIMFQPETVVYGLETADAG